MMNKRESEGMRIVCLWILAVTVSFLLLLPSVHSTKLDIFVDNEIILNPGVEETILIVASNTGDDVIHDLSLNLKSNLEAFFYENTDDLKRNQERTWPVEINAPEKPGEYTLHWTVSSKEVIKEGEIIIKVTGIPRALKEIYAYYIDQLAMAEERTALLDSETQAKIQEAKKDLEETKRLLDNNDFFEASNKLDDIKEKTKFITASFFITTEEELLESQKAISETPFFPFWIFQYLLLTILGISALFYFKGRIPLFHPRIPALNQKKMRKIADSIKESREVQREMNKSEELRMRIKSLEGKVDENLAIDLKLVKQKYKHGMFTLCEEYLKVLEEKVKGVAHE